ncbi:MAG: prepilin-type N-terminal cleavage/methylation domain-containing protein [Deltaproteobacteria bacterium]|nr:prepilin-type N-terminal cleavage/methylation domain-containing protein [Deltaproteobacteria bacterium]
MIRRRGDLRVNRRKAGFTMLELLIVLSIMAVVVAMGATSWRQTQQNNKTKFMARQIAGAFEMARAHAIQEETVYGVYVNIGGARNRDLCGTVLPANQPIIVFIDNVTQNCCIDPGEIQVNFPEDATVAGSLAWGATWALAPVPTDQGTTPANMAAGTTFPFIGAGTAPLVLMRPDGVPVLPDNVCNQGNLGTGTGGFYLTTNTTTAAQARDFAVVITPLGATRIHSYERGSATWTN